VAFSKGWQSSHRNNQNDGLVSGQKKFPSPTRASLRSNTWYLRLRTLTAQDKLPFPSKSGRTTTARIVIIISFMICVMILQKGVLSGT
jgi:hypothetical protein